MELNLHLGAKSTTTGGEFSNFYRTLNVSKSHSLTSIASHINPLFSQIISLRQAHLILSVHLKLSLAT
jgi:hypothetical protein